MKTNQLSICLLAAALSVLPACGQHEDPPGPASIRTQEIVNGDIMTPEQQQHYGTVGIWVDGLGLFDQRPKCSGVLIRPDWVLTAKHCSTGVAAGAYFTVTLTGVGSRTAHNYRAILHPTKDLALLQLFSPFPVNVPGEIWPFDSSNSLPVYPLLAAGQGYVDLSGGGAGTWRSMIARPRNFDGVTYQVPTTNGKLIINGDSGGPSFLPLDNGRFMLTGIHSAGNLDYCLDVAMTLDVRSWIARNMPPPPPPTSCGVILPGQGLGLDQGLRSCDGRFLLYMQSDGNLVLFLGSNAIWTSQTGGSPASGVVMQGDGNLVLYGVGPSFWHSATYGNPGAQVALQNDGNLVIHKDGRSLWHSGTYGHVAPPPPPTSCGVILPGQGLGIGQSLYSCDGRFQLYMQPDGNLLLLLGGNAIWTSQTNGRPAEAVVMQADGNLVLYGRGQSFWHSATYGNPGAQVALQNDGNLVIHKDGRSLWHSGTYGH